ncbi:MAG TPA: histidinol dehydrogenase, partial [Tepidisphaeraceae bacterium]|nr:histidinol dehydrogenase [Tepidisphaeraceae bacterium]
ALGRGHLAEKIKTVNKVLADVAERGDDALVDLARQFDDPDFTIDQLRIDPAEMKAGADRIPADLRKALQRSITQVREYQSHILPKDPEPLRRPGVELGLRFTPIDSAGLLFPGGKASYPSTLIMLAVPAQVAGVKRIAGFTPPSKFGRSDLVLAACHELGLTEVYRAGGPGAVAAMAFGTKTIQPVDKILGPGNTLSQLAKRLLFGAVGIDGYLGPSEVLVLADESANPAFVAADLMAQAEHNPGSCFLLTTSRKLAEAVLTEIEKQLPTLKRADAIRGALAESSVIIISNSMDTLIDLSNRFAAEHLSLQVQNEKEVLKKLTYAGAIFVGPYSPVAAGDYIAGPSHCLPTNTTARFTNGVSVYEFLTRSSIERYEKVGLAADADAIISLANAEFLDAHANSVRVRISKSK